MLDAFDTECPCCHGEGIQREPVAETKPSVFWPRLKKAGFLLLFCLLLLVPCFKVYTLNQQDNVREAALRYIVGPKPYSKAPEFTGIGFVSFDGQDPNDAFLRRFQGDRFSVRKLSQAKIVPTRNINRQMDRYVNPLFRDDYIDKDTGEHGQPLPLGRLHWITPFKAEIESPLVFGGEKHTVIRQDGCWTVARSEQTVFF